MISKTNKVFFREENYRDIPCIEDVPFFRGDIVLINSNVDEKECTGSEQTGYRPAIIIQNDSGNKFSPTVIVAMITSQKKPNMPTHMHIYLDRDSTILCEQVRTIDKTRIRKKIGRIKREYMWELDHCIKVSFGLIEDYTKRRPVVYGR